jgi:hypothetical protein
VFDCIDVSNSANTDFYEVMITFTNDVGIGIGSTFSVQRIAPL